MASTITFDYLPGTTVWFIDRLQNCDIKSIQITKGETLAAYAVQDDPTAEVTYRIKTTGNSHTENGSERIAEEADVFATLNDATAAYQALVNA